MHQRLKAEFIHSGAGAPLQHSMAVWDEIATSNSPFYTCESHQLQVFGSAALCSGFGALDVIFPSQPFTSDCAGGKAIFVQIYRR
jgi:hypothetical protein